MCRQGKMCENGGEREGGERKRCWSLCGRVFAVASPDARTAVHFDFAAYGSGRSQEQENKVTR